MSDGIKDYKLVFSAVHCHKKYQAKNGSFIDGICSKAREY